MDTTTPTTETQTTPTEKVETFTATVTQPASTTSGVSETVSMTRAELDRQMGEARRTAERSVRDSQEVKDLREKAKRYQDLEDSQKTETQRLQDERDREKSRADTAETQRRDALIRSEFAITAPAKGVPADRIKAGLRLLDLDGVTVTETGEVKGLEKALDALVKDNPFLTAQAGGDKMPQYGTAGQAGAPSREAQIQQAMAEMRRGGRDIP
ncbi:MAG TPA: hypothetical protein VNM48_00520 [Chloroflexota bacterium]|nr:hypothetical protein [Chloroflexota bacterium]